VVMHDETATETPRTKPRRKVALRVTQ